MQKLDTIIACGICYLNIKVDYSGLNFVEQTIFYIGTEVVIFTKLLVDHYWSEGKYAIAL